MRSKPSDRPNIYAVVRPINSSLGSFTDLSFLLRNWKPGDPPPLTFLIFFDNINEAIKACLFLRSQLPVEYRNKIKWFNSDMSNTFKDDETGNLTTRNTGAFVLRPILLSYFSYFTNVHLFSLGSR